MSREPLLFLCHRIPYPPNKGDKIATYNILRYLNERYDIHLGFFIDDNGDTEYADVVKQWCKALFFVDITNRSQTFSGIKSLLLQKPVTITHYISNDMQAWVSNTIRQHDIKNIFVYSSGVAQFIDGAEYGHCTRVVDMADIDSDKWHQYARAKRFPSKLIYDREYRLLYNYEQQLLRDMSYVGLVTQKEVELFRTLSPAEQSQKVVNIPNGVDTSYFNPQSELDYSDFPEIAGPYICFTGAMDYWANVDAVVWFCEHAWPIILKALPQLQFFIVGGGPPEKVIQLGHLEGVTVTGRVADVRPFLKHAECVVAPLRIARGVQNKVLEAMAMSKAVVMTTMAEEGIVLPSEQKPLVTDSESEFASLVIKMVKDPELKAPLETSNRDYIVERFSWVGALSIIDTLFKEPNI